MFHACSDFGRLFFRQHRGVALISLFVICPKYNLKFAIEIICNPKFSIDVSLTRSQLMVANFRFKTQLHWHEEYYPKCVSLSLKKIVTI